MTDDPIVLVLTALVEGAKYFVLVTAWSFLVIERQIRRQGKP